ncbi:hypothetical protein HK100_007415 [Physocladia obscura]|uniref:Tudor domain-containing protein n=1 Tax=Physocladia obscura TaxID=109957 RepID=A0AAD5XAT9_9FUNG|nr:hypothetical protein HK100_007415 [Physocladia obscura]
MSDGDDYQFQLAQVEEALSRDANNVDLQRLKADLKELIALMSQTQQQQQQQQQQQHRPKQQNNQQQLYQRETQRESLRNDDHLHNRSPLNQLSVSLASPAAAAVDSMRRWVKGQTVLAKYAKDSKMYEAIVEAVPTANADFYQVIFKGYTSKEKVSVEDVRDFDPTQVAKPIAAVSGGAKNKRTTTPKAVAAAFSNGTDRASKRKRNNLEYHEAIKAKESEQNSKQNTWLSFASGGSSGGGVQKKKIAALKTTAPLKKTSIFSTPDDPTAKVGVVGSGKGMTHFQQRGKHVYDRVD